MRSKTDFFNGCGFVYQTEVKENLILLLDGCAAKFNAFFIIFSFFIFLEVPILHFI